MNHGAGPGQRTSRVRYRWHMCSHTRLLSQVKFLCFSSVDAGFEAKQLFLLEARFGFLSLHTMDDILAIDEGDDFDGQVWDLLRVIPLHLHGAFFFGAAIRVRGKPPLHRAIFGNDTATVRRLLLCSSVAAVHDAGDTGTQFAAMLGHTECVRLLLGASADANASLLWGGSQPCGGAAAPQ